MKYPKTDINFQNPSSYDVIVFGASPAGIAGSIRAAREKLNVLLIEPSKHVGGMWASGLQGFDTRYSGNRCPILSEFLERIQQYYIENFGKDSPEHVLSQFRDPTIHGNRPKFEAHVAESVFRQMIREQDRLTLLLEYDLQNVRKEDAKIQSLLLNDITEVGQNILVSGSIFVDATYTADLAAISGVHYHVGREGKQEFEEEHAGRLFTKIEPIGDTGHKKSNELNLHYFNRTARKIFPGSDGKADDSVQAYCVRLTLTDVDENRKKIPKPDDYDKQQFKGIIDRNPEAYQKRYPLGSHFLGYDFNNDSEITLKRTLQNGKTDWFGANYVGQNHDYPDASPKKRASIYHEHVNHALGMLYFLQHDSAIPFSIRENFRQWGLPKDEYLQSENIPWMMYVREARRIRGKYVFSEMDAIRHSAHERTPIHSDSIAFAEWPMDSHDCNPVRMPGSGNDGEFILADETFPSQIPYRCLISDEVKNLLVPVCMSATHVGWGTLRLEPVFVHTGEVAGVAASVCIRDNISPNELNASVLQRELLKKKIVVSYFSDLDLGRTNHSDEAIQYLSTQGFFGGYRAEPDKKLQKKDTQIWQVILDRWIESPESVNSHAGFMSKMGDFDSDVRELNIDSPSYKLFEKVGWDTIEPILVKEASQRMFSILQSIENKN